MLSSIFPPKVVSQPDADGHYNPFPSYPFTGSLRPVYPLSPRRAVPEKIRHPDYAQSGIPYSEQVSMIQVVKLDKADMKVEIRRQAQRVDPEQRRAGRHAQGLSAGERSPGCCGSHGQTWSHDRRDRQGGARCMPRTRCTCI